MMFPAVWPGSVAQLIGIPTLYPQPVVEFVRIRRWPLFEHTYTHRCMTVTWYQFE
jgi:hypothetical protein